MAAAFPEIITIASNTNDNIVKKLFFCLKLDLIFDCLNASLHLSFTIAIFFVSNTGITSDENFIGGVCAEWSESSFPKRENNN